VSLERWRDYLRDRWAMSLRPNDELRTIAAEAAGPVGDGGPEAMLARARRLDAWVRRSVKTGGDLDDAATMALARREGNLHVVLAARSCARPASRRSCGWCGPWARRASTGRCRRRNLYSELLVALCARRPRRSAS